MTISNMRPLNVLRYSNRKLYAINAGYIALRDVRQAVYHGRKVQVTEYATGVDVTDSILASIVAADAWRGDVPAGMCYAFIQNYMKEAAHAQ